MNNITKKIEGLIYLEDGSVFKGKAFGAAKTVVGEIVFNTAMTGYQGLITNPVTRGQIINMTYPLIGNYGISDVDSESNKIQALGLIVKNLCETPSNARSKMSLAEFMTKEGVPGISGVDTRKIARKIRENGTMKCLISTEEISLGEAKERCLNEELKFDLVKGVSTKESYDIDSKKNGYNVAVIDFGITKSTIKALNDRGCALTVYPYNVKAEQLLKDSPDGIFLSNGPGNPQLCKEAIIELRKIMNMNTLPIFGMGMGHQILAIALGAKTYKMKHAHRGSNHGIYDKAIKRSYIAMQNHGYAVQNESMIQKGIEITHLNLNDGTVEGMEHRDLPFFSVQFMPETGLDKKSNSYLYDKFINFMKEDEKNA